MPIKNNSNNLYFLLTILTYFFSFSSNASEVPCPKLNNALEVAQLFVKADMVGARLTGETFENLNQCIELETQAAWDLIQVIGRYELNDCTKNSNDSKKCVELKFSTLGTLNSAQKFQKNTEAQMQSAKLLMEEIDGKWHLEGLSEIPPLLSKNGILQYLERQHNKENSSNFNEWLSSSTEAIEKL